MEEEFMIAEKYLESSNFEKWSKSVKELVEELLNKLNEHKEISFKISERNKNIFVLVPNVLIDAGRAYKGASFKNIITVTYRKSKNELVIEVEPNDKQSYRNVEEINSNLIERIIIRYNRLLKKHYEELGLKSNQYLESYYL